MFSEEKIKVLVVDNDITLRDMYSDRLEAEGCEVEIAQDGEQGLERAAQFKPDIILLEIMIPRVNGFMALEKLKATPDLKDIPVILLTALVQEENMAKAIKAGAADYIIKSQITPGKIIEKIKEVLGKNS
jgi:CheY-like chemotaxis protein